MVSHLSLVRVRWSEADSAGIVFYPRFFEWFDLATEGLFSSLGLPWPEIFPRYRVVGVPIVDCGARFSVPVRYGDEVKIRSTVVEVREKTFRVEHEVVVGDTSCATGFEVRAWVGVPEEPGGRLRAKPFPGEVARLLTGEQGEQGDGKGQESRKDQRRALMKPQVVFTKSAPKTGFSEGMESPIAQGVKCGPFLFVSGQGPLHPVTKDVVSPDLAEQTRVTLDNVKAVLEAGGTSLENVVKVGVFLRQMDDFPVFNRVFKEYFKGVEPARTTVEAAAPRAGVNVEIDAIAFIP